MLLVGLRRRQLRRLFESRGMDVRDATLKIALLGDLDGWSPADLGKEVGLTWDERVACDIRDIDPFDKAAAEFEALKKKRNQEGNNIRAKRYRARAKEARQRENERVAVASNIDAREDALFLMIGDNPMSVPDLVALCVQPCWHGPDGRELPVESRSRLIRRVLDRLKAAGLIADELRPGHYKPVRWCWRAPGFPAVASLKIV
jgi:hypothetical protein